MCPLSNWYTHHRPWVQHVLNERKHPSATVCVCSHAATPQSAHIQLGRLERRATTHTHTPTQNKELITSECSTFCFGHCDRTTQHIAQWIDCVWVCSYVPMSVYVFSISMHTTPRKYMADVVLTRTAHTHTQQLLLSQLHTGQYVDVYRRVCANNTHTHTPTNRESISLFGEHFNLFSWHMPAGYWLLGECAVSAHVIICSKQSL